MSVINEDFELSNGVMIPKVGFGTWKIPPDVAPQAVQTALHAGYRHVDTARAYRNEEGVGLGIKASGVPRDYVFVTTKIPSALKTYEEIGPCIDESLRLLGLAYIDLLLIHAPKPYPPQPGDDRKTYFEENAAVWQAMEEAYDDGKLRAIGVSNFGIVDIDNLLDTCAIKPMVNQIEFHVGFTEDELTGYCQLHDILVEAYSPLAIGALVDNPDIAAVAARVGVTVPQLCIRYCLQLGTLPLPRSVNPDHIAANKRLDFEISDDDMAALDAISVQPAG